MEKKSVFISYSSKDQRYIQKIIHMLDKMGISYWVAPDMIPAGSNYAREIPSAIKGCDVFLLVLSASSQGSIWVEKEIDSAINCRKTIVPFQIDDAPMSDMFRFYLNNVQIIHSVNRPKEAIEDLKQRLRRLVKAGEGQREASHEKSGRRSKETALTLNRVPDNCQYCGGSLKKISSGVYQCNRCGKENYDDLRTVKKYLETNGAKSLLVIERDTGVPRRVIEEFLKQEYLEIPKLEKARLSCEKCGAPIRSGTLCDTCKYGNRRISAAKRGAWRSTGRR